MRNEISAMLIVMVGFIVPAAAQDLGFNLCAEQAAVEQDSRCDSCDGQSCGCPSQSCCDPWLHAEVNALYWTRGNPKSAPIARFMSDDSTMFNADEFSFNWRPGVEGDFAIRLEGPLSVNCRYFWLDDFNARAFLPAPFDNYNYGNTGVSGGLNLNQRYLSGLQGAEANFVYQHKPWLAWIIGFRWNQIKERLTAGVSNNFPYSYAEFNFDTNNDLYGGQIGADARIINGKHLNVNVLGKIGVLGNFASADSFLDYPAGQYYSFAHDTDSKTAMVFELRCEARWRFNDHWAATAGYSLMWFDGVALASNQVNATANLYTPPFTGPVETHIDVRDTIFYHGGFAGLECRF
jgi:hypothetical protein